MPPKTESKIIIAYKYLLKDNIKNIEKLKIKEVYFGINNFEKSFTYDAQNKNLPIEN